MLRRSWLAFLLWVVVTVAGANDYRIDPQRSHAQFGVRLLWIHTIGGRFEQIAGEVSVNDHGLAQIDARIAVASIAMDSERLRRWVLAPEFFDAAHYPSIRFLSRPLPLAELNRGGVLQGSLSMRGVTRPARFELKPVDCEPGTDRACLIQAHGTLLRSDFGMHAYRGALADRIQLDLAIEIRTAPR